MSIGEFKKIHKASKNEYIDYTDVVFSILYYDPMGNGPYKKFYYFENSKLIKVDKGERALDYRIKID